MGDLENALSPGPDATIIRLNVAPSLPCAMHDCGRPATHALAEPDPACPGLWQLVPVCDICAMTARQRLSTERITDAPPAVRHTLDTTPPEALLPAHSGC